MIRFLLRILEKMGCKAENFLIYLQIRKERNIKSTVQRLNMPILLRYPLAQMIYSI